MLIRELFANKANWSRRIAARDKYGTAVDVTNKTACCFCLLGAIHRCYPEDTREIKEKVYKYLRDTYRETSIGQFNDDYGYEAVKTLAETLNI